MAAYDWWVRCEALPIYVGGPCECLLVASLPVNAWLWYEGFIGQALVSLDICKQGLRVGRTQLEHSDLGAPGMGTILVTICEFALCFWLSRNFFSLHLINFSKGSFKQSNWLNRNSWEFVQWCVFPWAALAPWFQLDSSESHCLRV